ncbi:16825_t:CDS:10, partial [Entrophospora sp. SA101]
MRNIKDRTSEDELHFQDGSILHVDACVGDIPIVLMEEKQLDAEVAKAKLDIYRKFHWPPHYKDLSFVIAIAFSGNIVIFNKLTCGKIYVDELHLNLSFVEDRVRCEIEPSSHWGSHITINYSSVLKVFFSINDLEIQRIQNFYVNNNIPFLETAIRNEIKKKVFHLELTPVGLPCSPSDLNTLQVAMYCFVHALLKVHQNGWSVIDLRCPNTIEFNGCYCIIDASEYAIQHEHKFTINENISNESDDYDDYDSDEEAILNIKLDDDYEKEEEDEEEEKKSSKKSINHNNDDISNDDNDDIPDLTFEMITKWQKSITESKSLKSTHRLILAFRAAAHLNDDENEKTYSYKITDPTVFNNLLVICMKYIPGVFNHHLKVEDTDVSKNKLPCFNHKWKTLELMVKSFLNNVLYILKQLTDKNMINFFTKESEKILHYYASIPKLATQYLKAVLQIWGFADDKSRILIFLNIHKLAILAPPPFIDFCLKTTAFTIPSINLMGNCAVQIYGIDFKSSYQSAFNYIRQLAINLRNAMNVKSKDSHRLIYNWQFIHCIEYWSRILGTYCDQRRIAEGGESSLQELIYPFVQVTIEYFPLRFHCIRSLINLIKTTGTFIPLATFLFDILQSKEV